MAEKRRKGFPIPAKLVEGILMGQGDTLQLQDSPILGDVWIAYAEQPAEVQDLLITPQKDVRAGAVASEISGRLARMQDVKVGGFKPQRKTGEDQEASIAYLQGIVAAKLYFDEVLSVLVPMTQWWSEKDVKGEFLKGKRYTEELARWIGDLLDSVPREPAQAGKIGIRYQFNALDRYVALAGLILWASNQPKPPQGKSPTVAEVCRKIRPHINDIAKRLFVAFEVVDKLQAVKSEFLITQVSINRPAAPALDKSIPAVKADAARGLFGISCKEIAWAVVDSGIDAGHPALQTEDGSTSRVREALDFTRVRDIISSDTIKGTRRDQLLDGIKLDKEKADKSLDELVANAKAGLPTNWDLVEKLITLKNDTPPQSFHGTHVAGIIGARPKPNAKDHPGGMCPDIWLYDFRVLGSTLAETEFAVISALQYVRYVNERYPQMSIHGVNLSLSIPHNVRNYACGSTPVCKECEKVVASGVVVVAAAGNRGYQHFQTSEGTFENYAAFSITDPGNADGVITVGATHRYWPHTYGVSFFSSRGPTGDGRPKPDIVAPGERIEAPVPGGNWEPQSGTSMAAPHASGAAALLLARYSELIGQPKRVKQVLCDTATNLGRERSFQGYGMLDVLRALQSI